MSGSELEDELATLAAHLSAGMCRWLELVGELDRRHGWAEEGCGSCAAWLAWRCALAPRAARDHVRVARRLPELPLIHAGFARGQLSYTKVRALTRVATGDNERELLELARFCTAAQLERTLRAYHRVTTSEARDQQEDAYLSVFWNPDGTLELHGRLAADDGALVLRALDALRDSSWKSVGGSAEPRRARQASNAEALVAVADAAIAHDGEQRPAGERYQVIVDVDEHVLETDGEGSCELDDGSALAPETVRRLACDASVVRNGRRSRAVPSSLRRALHRRDRGCRFPGCENRRFVDAHHVRHWAHGGETRLDNLVLLCRRHHRAVHEGGYRVDGDGTFFDRWGHVIPLAPESPRGDVRKLAESNRGSTIDAGTCASGTGERIDLDYVVAVLLE